LLETFLGFVAVVVFLVTVVFLEETFGVAVFLTAGFEAVFPLGFLGATVFLGLSVTSLGAAFLRFSVAGFFTAFAVVLLGLSPAEDGFLVAIEVVFLTGAGFLF
jgi:hypothetical protein